MYNHTVIESHRMKSFAAAGEGEGEGGQWRVGS